jgi:hypothetical protein
MGPFYDLLFCSLRLQVLTTLSTLVTLDTYFSSYPALGRARPTCFLPYSSYCEDGTILARAEIVHPSVEYRHKGLRAGGPDCEARQILSG